MPLEQLIQENTAALRALTAAILGTPGAKADPAADAAPKASPVGPKASPVGPKASTPAEPPAEGKDPPALTYEDVAVVVREFVKARPLGEGREAALEILSGFKNAKGQPLATASGGKWVGGSQGAQPADFGAIIAAFKGASA